MKKPSSRNSSAGLLRHPPVALEDVRSAHFENADLAVGDRVPPLLVDHAQLDIRKREADRAGAPLAVVGVRGVHVRFGHAVAFENAMAGPLLEGDMRFGKQRRAARGEEPHVRHQFPVEARIVEQAGVEGRHAHHRRRLRQPLDDLVHLERRQEDHRAAGKQHDVAGDEKAVRMEDRQRVQQDVVGREAPCLDQRTGVRQQVAVRQHGAFRAAGRPGGVEERGKIVRTARDGREVLRKALELRPSACRRRRR